MNDKSEQPKKIAIQFFCLCFLKQRDEYYIKQARWNSVKIEINFYTQVYANVLQTYDAQKRA